MKSSTIKTPTCAATFLIALGLASPGSAAPAAESVFTAYPVVRVVYYDVSGTTAQQVRASINARGLVDPDDGARSDAYTTWRIVWSWPPGPSGSCGVSRATARFSATVTLPRLISRPQASAALVKRWDRYFDGLLRHELGHVQRANAGLARVIAAVRSSTCETANSAGNAEIARLRREDDLYDRMTAHGRLQGAVFP